MLLTRGPSFRDPINDSHGDLVVKALKHLEEVDLLPEAPGDLQKEIDEKGIENILKAQIHPTVSLPSMIKLALTMALTLLHKKWYLYKTAKKEKFITSDNPVAFTFENNYTVGGPVHPKAIISLTLSKNVALIIKPESEEISYSTESNLKMYQASSSKVSDINRAIICAANEYVYLSEKNEAIRLQVAKYKDHSQKIFSETPNPKSFSIIKDPYSKHLKRS